ncbi:MAG: hypothetical protein WC654_04250 [Patescibacteria group bacterium]
MSIPTPAELEKRWWHRLIRILIWIVSGIATLFGIFIFILSLSEYYDFNYFTLLFFLLGPLIYLFLSLFYRKIIIYIVFGSNEKTDTRRISYFISALKRVIIKNRLRLFAVILVILILGIIGWFSFDRATLRNLRYEAYVINLRIGAVYNIDTYFDLLSTDQDTYKYRLKTKIDSKIYELNDIFTDLAAIGKTCETRPVCRQKLANQLVEMNKSIEAGREYFEKFGKNISDIIFIRDRAIEINRAVRLKYFLSPDPSFPAFTKKQLSDLIDLQWSVNHYDLIRQKRLCDEATSYMIDSAIFSNICEQDLFLGMLTFNFTDGEQNPKADMQSVCNLEKNYALTPTCPITLSKVESVREKYRTYLSTHKNPYLSVSELPYEKRTEIPNDQSKVVAGFYDALAKGRGDLAVKFVTPKKQEIGSFTASGLTKYWSNLLLPLGVLTIEASDEPNVYSVLYIYQARGKDQCIDTARVELEKIGDTWYISQITPKQGC